ncbi:hypothetical protein PR048_022776 [Dryococelus australis]|uniref:Tetratricopeptide repeat protein n=1 Tax=Dryococelus australis TaxID=614101 RepID=A0ABQ9GS68_9NEOP|nr:hypothetical protein PR048_022776 [Dryococelus australis]
MCVVVAHLNLGQLLERLRRCDEAIAVYRRCSRLDGTRLKDPRTHEAARVSALLHLGRLYADQGRLHDAAQAYQEAVHSMPEYYPSQVRVSSLYTSPVWHRYCLLPLCVVPDYYPSQVRAS